MEIIGIGILIGCYIIFVVILITACRTVEMNWPLSIAVSVFWPLLAIAYCVQVLYKVLVFELRERKENSVENSGK